MNRLTKQCSLVGGSGWQLASTKLIKLGLATSAITEVREVSAWAGISELMDSVSIKIYPLPRQPVWDPLWWSRWLCWGRGCQSLAATEGSIKTKKIWRICLWRKNMGDWPILVRQSGRGSQLNGFCSLGRSMVVGKVQGSSLPSGQYYHTQSKLQMESIAAHLLWR